MNIYVLTTVGVVSENECNIIDIVQSAACEKLETFLEIVKTNLCDNNLFKRAMCNFEKEYPNIAEYGFVFSVFDITDGFDGSNKPLKNVVVEVINKTVTIKILE